MIDELQIREDDRVEIAEYRALRGGVEWDHVPAGDEELQAALDRTWNVTADPAKGAWWRWSACSTTAPFTQACGT